MSALEIVEIISNDTAKLRALKFPAGSTTTQYPVEHLEEYMEMFGVENKQQNLTEDSLPNSVLLFVDSELKLPEKICSKTFGMETKDNYDNFKLTSGKLKLRAYPFLASYPPREFCLLASADAHSDSTVVHAIAQVACWMLFFSSTPENALHNYLQAVLPAHGGYGRNKEKIRRIVKI